MDLNKLTIGDKVLVAAGLVFGFATLLPWFGESFINGFATDSLNGLDYFFTGVVPFLLIEATVVVVLLTRLGDVTLPELPMPLNQLLLIPAGVATFLVLIRLIIGDGVGGEFVDLSRKGGIFLAVLSAIGVCVGAALRLQEGDDSPTHGSAPPQAF